MIGDTDPQTINWLINTWLRTSELIDDHGFIAAALIVLALAWLALSRAGRTVDQILQPDDGPEPEHAGGSTDSRKETP